MIHELDTSQYETVKPLFTDALDEHLAIFSLIAGASPGLIMVDDPEKPTSALAITGSRLYLAGDADNTAFHQAIGQFVTDEFVPMSKAAKQEAFVLHYAPDAWAEHVDTLFPGLFPVADERLYFDITALKYPQWREMLPENMTVRAVKDIIETELTHTDRLRAEMRSERESVADFLEKSFGYCAVVDDDLAGWCMSEYNLAGRCEIGVETVETYQQQGIATALASAVIEQALQTGITRIGWHCWAHNAASIATAQKLTDAIPIASSVFVAYFDGAMNLAITGNRYYMQGDIDAALRFLQKSMAQGNAPEWAYYLAGCCHALHGKSDTALRFLNVAVDRGWTHMRQTLTDPALEPLKTHPGWRELLRKLALVQE